MTMKSKGCVDADFSKDNRPSSWISQMILVFLCCGILHSASCLPGIQKLWRNWPSHSEPELLQTDMNMTAVVGKALSMPCKVKNLQDKTVSWIRGKDLTVLAVDTVTYTGDQRFTVKHEMDSEEWYLHLRDVTRSDEGVYDCQINTYPKLSTKIYLKVVPKTGESSFLDIPVSDTVMTLTRGGGSSWREVSHDPVQSEPQKSTSIGVILKIKGRKWVSLKEGETLILVCEATEFYGPIAPIFNAKNQEDKIIRWTLDDVPLHTLFPEWKAIVKEKITPNGFESELTLNSVGGADGGKVSCLAPHSRPDSINLQIEKEKSRKQHYSGASSSRTYPQEGNHFTYPVTSAVSGASIKKSNSKFAILCTAFLVFFTLTNIAVCFHYLRKS